MNLTTQLGLFFAAKGLGVYQQSGVGGNIFSQTSPAAPDQIISIYTRGGPPGDRTGEYIREAVQILIRTVEQDPRDGETLAREVIKALNGYNSKQLIAGGHYIIDVEALQAAPNNIGQDANGRFEYSQNFVIEYKS